LNGGLQPDRREEVLLGDAILRPQRLRRRTHEQWRDRNRASAGTFSTGDGATLRELVQRRQIHGPGADVLVGDTPRRALCAGVEDYDVIPHALGRHGKHAAELAATEQAEPGAGRDHLPELTLREAAASLRRLLPG
jgi:hypothetical protein